MGGRETRPGEPQRDGDAAQISPSPTVKRHSSDFSYAPGEISIISCLLRRTPQDGRLLQAATREHAKEQKQLPPSRQTSEIPALDSTTTGVTALALQLRKNLPSLDRWLLVDGGAKLTSRKSQEASNYCGSGHRGSRSGGHRAVQMCGQSATAAS